MNPLRQVHTDRTKDPQQKSQKLRSIQREINKGFSSRYMQQPWGFTISNKKKEELQRMRKKEIQREDKALSNRIIENRQKRRHSFNNDVESIYLKNPLHFSIRKQHNRILVQENLIHKKRIQNLKPIINIRKHEKDWQSKEDLKRFLQKYYSNEVKDKSKSIDLSKVQHFSEQKILKFCKERLINGFNVLIKIQEYKPTILISAQIKEKNLILSITVEKDKIQSILDNNCKGKLQNLGNLFKFDTQTNSLYYIPEDSAKGECLISEKCSDFELKSLRALLRRQHLLLERKEDNINDLDKLNLQKTRAKQQPTENPTQIQQPKI